ncbi:MAG: TrkH family potassium uptake protein [Thermodesulfobacteriota bacterium]|nr:TrkH family potassium uptake protein [Thermodesulfobacteriota bacterium]
MTLRRLLKMNAASLLLLSYLAAIGIGTLLLILPPSTADGRMAFIDALFTATSAICVTGLVVVDTGSFFTPFGQAILLFMIQLGGLGIMTLSVTVFQLMGRDVSFRQRMILQDVFSHTPRQDIFQLLKAILVFTAATEAVGMVLLVPVWIESCGWPRALYVAAFHSVSAFCNAGFSLFSESFADFRGNPLLNATVCSLIVLGGIGFPVVYDLIQGFKPRHIKENRTKRLVQTKTVLATTAVLIVTGAAVFAAGEHENVLKAASFGKTILVSCFQSITCRTAGFNTVDIRALSSPTLMLMLFLMFIGASPGSCGGGIKTTSLAVLVAFGWSRLWRRARVNLFKKSIPRETVIKTLALVVLSISLIFLSSFVLLFTLPPAQPPGTDHERFLSILFEVFSAFGTVGLSMGATATLDTMGKAVIIFMMLVGRVGVLTFAYVIAGISATRGVEYAEENIMIG